VEELDDNLFDPRGFNLMAVDYHIDFMNKYGPKIAYVKKYLKVIEIVRQEKNDLDLNLEKGRGRSDNKHIEFFADSVLRHMRKKNEELTREKFDEHYNYIFNDILMKLEKLLLIKERYFNELKEANLLKEAEEVENEVDTVQSPMLMTEEEKAKMDLYDFIKIKDKMRDMSLGDRIIYLEENIEDIEEEIRGIESQMNFEMTETVGPGDQGMPEFNRYDYMLSDFERNRNRLVNYLNKIKEKLIFKTRVDELMGEGQDGKRKKEWTGTKSEFARFVNETYEKDKTGFKSRRKAAHELFEEYDFSDKSWTKERCYDLVRQT
jgi:hypothetical protein